MHREWKTNTRNALEDLEMIGKSKRISRKWIRNTRAWPKSTAVLRISRGKMTIMKIANSKEGAN